MSTTLPTNMKVAPTEMSEEQENYPLVDAENVPTKEELAEMQSKHLRYLEEHGSRGHKVCGVPVLQALSYNLIQVVNNLYLNDVLNTGSNGDLEEELREELEKENE